MCFSKTFDASASPDAPSLSVEERADWYVRRLQGFYVHLAAYVGGNALLVGINLLTSPGVFWAIWPILGWGVKLSVHAVTVFGESSLPDWKARVRRSYRRRHTDRPASHLDGSNDSPPETEAEQLRQRIEHLEAIVTSADWDLLADLDDDAPADKRAAALADDVVPQ